MGRLRQFVRILVGLLHVLTGAVWIGTAVAWDRLRRRRPVHGLAVRAHALWARLLCALLGVRRRRTGAALVEGPALIVCNHISWLDVPVLAAELPVVFLSKSELRGWPVVGPVATGLGTLYIERGRKHAASAAIAAISERLAAGERVLIFPEGTTGTGEELLPFRPRLYQAAVAAGVPVQPASLRYLDAAGGRCRIAPFVGDTPLLKHVLRLTRTPRLRVELALGEPIPSAGRGRSALAQLSAEAVAALG